MLQNAERDKLLKFLPSDSFSDISPMNSFTKSVADSLGRHFVTLSCVQYPSDSSEMRIHVFSGFVMAINGEWFYVTAGHILRDIKLSIDSGAVFDIWRLGDQTAGKCFANTAVPYDFQLDKWLVLENADAGLDYATVHIDGLLRLALEAGGVIALEPSSWGDHLTDHKYWSLVGIPKESVAYDGKTIITARVVMAPLIPTEMPHIPEYKAHNQFYAKLADGSDDFVKDIDGMSGGPIFMLCKVEETWKYKVIGVQSAWYPSSRTVAACPFASFGEALEPIVEQAMQLTNSTARSEV